jgi:hypothetical protein
LKINKIIIGDRRHANKTIKPSSFDSARINEANITIIIMRGIPKTTYMNANEKIFSTSVCRFIL